MKAEAGVKIMRKPLSVDKTVTMILRVKDCSNCHQNGRQCLSRENSLHYIDNSFQRIRKIVNSTKTITVLVEKNK